MTTQGVFLRALFAHLLLAATCAASSTTALADPSAVQKTALHTDVLKEDYVAPKESRWVDSSHRFATDQTMALTRWVDSFFGDIEGDAEIAESRLRVKLSTEWDARLPNQNHVTVGGKIDLPRLANRVDLVFRGDDPDELIRGDQNDPSQSQVGIQVNLDESASGKHRTDLTVGLSSSGPKPGFKYRYHTALNANTALRFSQRAQYDLDDGAYATTKLDADYVLSETSLLRTQNRVLFGRDAEGMEWSTNFGRVRQWTDAEGFERASFLYFEVQGQTKPYSHVNNYQLGLRFRAQALRKFLFFELEPTFNYRIDEPYAERKGAWAIEARVEFLLFD
jgi:hypothetical protein